MKMKKNKSLVIIAILMAIGLGFASCDPNGGEEYTPSDIYIVTSALNGYSAAGKELQGTTYTTIQDAINAIKDDAEGEDCTIQFGNGSDVLDIGTAFVSFGDSWGLITLTGKITSANTSNSQGTIVLEGSANIESKADITNIATSTNARGINNRGTGTLTISEGTVSVETGVALFNFSTGKIAVTGGNVTSRNSATTSGTIHIASSGTITDTRLEITGGTIGNTSTGVAGNGNAIRNLSSGAVKISGGTVSATAANGFAIYSTHSNGQLIMSGSPDINRKIQTPYERISVETPFTPVKTISLNFNEIAINAVAVKNGKDFSDCFELFNQPDYCLIIKENDLVIGSLYNYGYEKSGTTYTITRRSDNITYPNIGVVIEAIKENAGGAACTIQFGNGTDTLNINQESVNFSGNWGLITLTGKITSINADVNEGTIVLRENVSIISYADIANTANTSDARTINNGHTDSKGNVTVRSGIISAVGGRAIYNRLGKITIEDGTVTSQNTQPSTGGTIFIVNTSNSSPDVVLEVLGGTISNTSSNLNCNAIRNRSKGTVKIGGGFISATATGFSISSDIAESQIFLSGNPDITHRIRVPYGVLSILDQFNPAARIYTLDFSAMTPGSIAVKDGANFISNFTLHQQPSYKLTASGNDLIINDN